MRISSRLYAIADKVPRGSTAADIGTDHGYVPMLLVKNNISPRVIMSDISASSLAKARETFALCGLDADDSCFRVGDGLSTVSAGEADTVIIAGLGGNTIIDILDADLNLSRSFSTLILQPRKHSGNLRHYLYTHGWDIISEDLAREGKFACEILTAVPSDVTQREELYPVNDIRWKYPETIIDKEPELAADRIGWKVSSIREQIGNLTAGKDDHSGLIARLRSELVYLEELLRRTGSADQK